MEVLVVFHRLAGEQKARVTYDNILRLVDDPDVRDVIKFLREREIVHFQRFGDTKLAKRVDFQTEDNIFVQFYRPFREKRKHQVILMLSLYIPDNFRIAVFADDDLVDQNHGDCFLSLIIGSFPGACDINDSSRFIADAAEFIQSFVQSKLFRLQLGSSLIEQRDHVRVECTGQQGISQLIFRLFNGLDFQL